MVFGSNRISRFYAYFEILEKRIINLLRLSMRLTSNYYRCLSIDALFEGGRMAVGAISVAFLMSTGLPLEDIAYLKIFQSIILILGELPTGLFADSFGSKKSLLAATLCSIVGFIIFANSKSMYLFIMAESLLALALCFWSGAYETFVIDSAKLNEKKELMDRYFHQNQSVNNLSVLFIGWIGGIIASKNLLFPYYLAIFLMLSSLYLIFKSPDHKIHHDNFHSQNSHEPTIWFNKIKRQLIETFQIGLKNPLLIPFFLANILIQFSIQPILHYWQPAFQEIIGKQNPEYLGNIFAAYCGLSVVLSIIFSSLTKYSWSRSQITTVFLFFIFSIFYYLFSISRDFISAVIFFALLQGFLSLARTSLGIRLNEIIPSKYRASILSTIGLASRIGMMVALFFIGKLVKNGESVFPMINTFSFLTFLAFVFILSGILLKRFTHNKGNS